MGRSVQEILNAVFIESSSSFRFSPVQAAVKVLKKVTAMDFLATGSGASYTVPTGKTLILTDVLIRATDITDFVAVATLRIGKTTAFTEWLAATALTGLNAVGKFVSLGSFATGLVHQTFAAGEAVVVNVTIGALATTFSGDVFFIGYLV